MDELERALDDCLQRLTSGSTSLAQCLARYPKYADQLRPMLETALEVRRGRQLRPSGALRDRTRAKVMSHIATHPRQPRKIPVVPRLAFVLVSLACALLLVGTGAAQAAMPGQPLYGLKLSSERAWRAAAPDPVAVDLVLANRRADELIVVSDKTASVASGQTTDASAEAQVLAAYTDVLDRLATETSGLDADSILEELKTHQSELSQAGIHVPKLDDIIAHGRRNNHGNGNGNGNGQGNGNGHNP